MLDCAAHMLLYFDDPQMLRRIALDHLLARFGGTRADIGFGSATAPRFPASGVPGLSGCDASDVPGLVWPNRHRALQSVWQSRRSLYFDVKRDPSVRDLRPALERARTRVKIARRLEYGDRTFGIVCIDQAEEERRWSEADLNYLDQFTVGFLSPIVAEIRSRDIASGSFLSAAERAVVQLASLGLSYKEIAAALNKSPNTVDNQLRKVRERFGVRNQIELLRACRNLL
jgi:DNA-binding CsgD family transcriptional regulator